MSWEGRGDGYVQNDTSDAHVFRCMTEPKTDEALHCKDCCCARSWKALGITEYTGKSIPEHIDSLRALNAQLEEAVLKSWWYFTDDGEAGCRYCKAVVEIPEDYDMTVTPKITMMPGCIVLSIESRRIKA